MNEEQWHSVIIQLKETAAKKGLTQVDIQFKTGLTQPTLSRMFDFKFCPTLKTVQKVADAIGCDLRITERSDPQFYINNEAAI